MGQNIEVSSGVDFADLLGKFVIVSDSDGNPYACAPLEETPHVASKLLAADISVYPDYTGPLSVSGEVIVTAFESGTSTYNLVHYKLDGADPACTFQGSAPNSCGVHVHSGTSCEIAADVGGHYYDEDGRDDPWGPISYFSI